MKSIFQFLRKLIVCPVTAKSLKRGGIMRLVTFANKSGEERLGALFDGDSRVADLAEAHRMRTGTIAPQLSSMQAVIEGGPPALDIARAALEHARSLRDGALAFGDVRLKAPLPRPV